MERLLASRKLLLHINEGVLKIDPEVPKTEVLMMRDWAMREKNPPNLVSTFALENSMARNFNMLPTTRTISFGEVTIAG
ncbi:uncharacterized protein LOC111004939 isoform X2 [Momordica charantia]|uniref:Uncharacterized protein LOC111004939 isoform X2 n=1 Tax=Momordica charantia TaxID=3673 RepID=A0A6J1BR09_MOMCH|nr:uncharacterized protein LOC111004939 isoform X2 [Momordica charantia]